MGAKTWRENTDGLQWGERVRVNAGPHAGEPGQITSVLREQGITYYQITLLDQQGQCRPEGGLLLAEELTPL